MPPFAAPRARPRALVAFLLFAHCCPCATGGVAPFSAQPPRNWSAATAQPAAAARQAAVAAAAAAAPCGAPPPPRVSLSFIISSALVLVFCADGCFRANVDADADAASTEAATYGALVPNTRLLSAFLCLALAATLLPEAFMLIPQQSSSSCARRAACSLQEAPSIAEFDYEARAADICGARGAVILTYDPLRLRDGAGAQLQRVMGIFAVSRALGWGYVHTPMLRIEQGLRTARGDEVEDQISRWNALFKLPNSGHLGGCGAVSVHTPTIDPISWGTSTDGCLHAYIDVPSLADVVALGGACNGRSVVLHVGRAQRIVDAFPELFSSPTVRFADALPWFPPRRAAPRAHARVAMHVRRGDLFLQMGDRMLPNSYYISLAQTVGRALTALNVPHVFELYSEAVVVPTNVTWGDGIVLLTPEQNAFADFNVLHPLEQRINTDPVEDIQRLASADVLITSKSSFSYVAGMFFEPGRGLVIYHPFENQPGMLHWFMFNPQSAGSEAALASRLALFNGSSACARRV